MKKILLFALGIVMMASMAFAQGGHLGLFSDGAYSDCNLDEQVGVIQDVYIVHMLVPEANSSQFQVLKDPAWTATAFPANWGSNLNIGDAYSGVAVTYVGCAPLPHLVGTLQFFAGAAHGACVGSPNAALEIVDDPNIADETPIVADCDGNIIPGTGGKLTVNGDESCPCEAVATRESSWSNIKALYQ